MSSPEEKRVEVVVPARAVVACPLKRFELAPVKNCVGCAKFGGLDDKYPGAGQIPFARRFTVKCFGAPIARPVAMIAEN